MKKTTKKLIALLLASVTAVLGATGVSAAAMDNTPMDTYVLSEKSVKAPSLSLPQSRRTSSYRGATVRRGSNILTEDAFVFDGRIYTSVNSYADGIGASVTYDAKTKTAMMTMKGLVFSVTDGCFTAYANERPLFSLQGAVLMNNGRIYLPVDILAKATGLRVSASGSVATLSGSVSPLISANKFYREDEVLWLARIIHAESRGEPLIGQIAVGNVVLNRVKSDQYPNTIYGVIFDRKYGVQFSPILDGSIYNTPWYTCTLAAKICLEGFDLSSGALFFLAPTYSTSSWIPKNRPYLFSIGGHDFYQ